MADKKNKTTDKGVKNKSKVNNANNSVSSQKEFGGRKGGLDPTRYGDWEKNGRCIDF